MLIERGKTLDFLSRQCYDFYFLLVISPDQQISKYKPFVCAF